jgi:hypothetical protein
LVRILADAYKPYLTDQLATVEYPGGVPDEITSGRIDCYVDNPEACVIFDRLLTRARNIQLQCGMATGD